LLSYGWRTSTKLVSIDEAKQQVAQAKTIIAQRRQEIGEARKQVDTAKGVVGSQRVVRAGGLAGLKARQKALGQIGSAEGQISEREQTIEEVEQQVQSVESQISAAESVKDDYGPALRAYSLRETEGGYVKYAALSPSQRRIYDQIESGESESSIAQEQINTLPLENLPRSAQEQLKINLAYNKRNQIDVPNIEVTSTPEQDLKSISAMSMDGKQFNGIPGVSNRMVTGNFSKLSPSNISVGSSNDFVSNLKTKFKEVTGQGRVQAATVPSGRGTLVDVPVGETTNLSGINVPILTRNLPDISKVPKPTITGAIVGTSEVATKVAGITAEGVTRSLEKVGLYKSGMELGTLPGKELTKQFPTRSTTISQGNYDPFTGKVVIPEKKIITPTPEQVGKGTETATKLGIYAVPYVGAAVAVSQGVEAFKEKVPTKEEIIATDLADLSPGERQAYLQTAEGQAYSESIDKYISQSKLQRNLNIGLGIGIPAVAGISRVVKAAREPSLFFKLDKKLPIPEGTKQFITLEPVVDTSGRVITPSYTFAADYQQGFTPMIYKTKIGKLFGQEPIKGKEATQYLTERFKLSNVEAQDLSKQFAKSYSKLRLAESFGSIVVADGKAAYSGIESLKRIKPSEFAERVNLGVSSVAGLNVKVLDAKQLAGYDTFFIKGNKYIEFGRAGARIPEGNIQNTGARVRLTQGVAEAKTGIPASKQAAKDIVSEELTFGTGASRILKGRKAQPKESLYSFATDVKEGGLIKEAPIPIETAERFAATIGIPGRKVTPGKTDIILISRERPTNDVVLFQGTTEKSAKNIVKEGIKPATQTGVSQGVAGDLDKVFTTKSVADAEGYANRAAVKKGFKEGKPAVLKIKLSPEEYKGLVVGEQVGKSGKTEVLLKEVPADKVSILDLELAQRNKKAMELAKKIEITLPKSKSAYEGLGTYEKTQETAGLIPLGAVKQEGRLQVKTAQLDLIQEQQLQPVLSQVKLQDKLQEKVAQLDLIKVQDRVQEKIQDRIETRLDQKLDLKLDTAQKLQPRQSTRQRESLRPGRPKPPRPTYTKKPKDISDFARGKSNIQLRQAFDVFVRKKGKEVRIGEGLTEGRALQLGTKNVKETLRASFKIKARGTTLAEDINFKVDKNTFVPGKRDSSRYVQRRGARLSSLGERREILSSKRRKKSIFGGL